MLNTGWVSWIRNFQGRTRQGGGLTASIESKIGPAIVEIGLLVAYPDGLDNTHLAGCRPEVLKLGCQLDRAAEVDTREVATKALMLAKAKGQGGVGLARGVELERICHLGWVACGLALQAVSPLNRKREKRKEKAGGRELTNNMTTKFPG